MADIAARIAQGLQGEIPARETVAGSVWRVRTRRAPLRQPISLLIR